MELNVWDGKYKITELFPQYQKVSEIPQKYEFIE